MGWDGICVYIIDGLKVVILGGEKYCCIGFFGKRERRERGWDVSFRAVVVIYDGGSDDLFKKEENHHGALKSRQERW